MSADNVIEDEISRPSPRCGIFCWRPDFLQIGYNWKLGLVLMSTYSFLRGVFTVGLASVNTASFERRFNVDSQQIGWFAAASKLAIAVSTVVFSYSADRTANKPRMLALSAFLNVLGSFLIALPHWLMPPYSSHSQQEVPVMCYLDDNYFHSLFPNATVGNLTTECRDSGSSYFGLLIFGNILKGVAIAVYITVGIAFIDDFSTMAASSFHYGITVLAMSVGTAVGFGLASGLLKIDVNFDKEGVPKQNPDDPAFLGAWWLGYAISIALFGCITIAFLFFDYELPETAKLRIEKIKKAQTHASISKVTIYNSGETGSRKLQLAVSLFFKHTLRVLSNPVVISATIAHIFSQLAVGGLQPFLVKTMQALWGLGETAAGMVMGVLVLIGIASGAFVSGYVAKRVEMTVRGFLLLSVFCTLLSTALCFSLALTCPQTKYSGINYDNTTQSYYPSSYQFNYSDLSLPCNSDCKCQPDNYSPVCDKETKLHYYSACYAGCQHFGVDPSNNKTDHFALKNCKCLSGDGNSVKNGLCDVGSGCVRMYFAMIGVFLMLFCGFFIVVPVTQAILRSVPLEERSFSLAFYETIQSFLGSVPAPLFMGTIMDQACIMRQPNVCNGEGDETGACAIYNSELLSWWLVGILAASTFLSSSCYLTAFLAYKPPNGEALGDYFRSLFAFWRKKCGRQGNDKRRPIIVDDDGPYTISGLESSSTQNISNIS